MTSDADIAAGRFIERMGLIAQGDNLPRIAGRILGLLVIEGGPLSFAAIAGRLRVSRASVSGNTRLLEGLGVIERVTLPGERGDYFQMAPEPYARLLRGVVERTHKARAVAEEARDGLPAGRTEARRRLDELAAFYRALGDGMERLIAPLSVKQ